MKHNTSAGFSLIDLLISLALVMTAFTGLVSMQTYSGQVSLNSQQTNDAIQLQDEFYTFLNDPLSCAGSFFNLIVDDKGSGNFSHPNQILKSDGVTQVFSVGQLDQGGRLQIQSMDLGDFDLEDGAFPRNGKAILKIYIGKNGEPIGPKTIRREIKLQVERNPVSKRLERCVAIGGKGGSQLWTLNPDGSIYYNGGGLGYVGIGTNNPSEPIDIVSENVGDQGILFEVINPTTTLNGNFEGRRARGTAAAPLPLLADDDVVTLEANAFDGTQFRSYSYIQTKAAANHAPGSAPAKIEFLTTTGAFPPRVQMVIRPNGRVGIDTFTPTAHLDVGNVAGPGNINASGCVSSSAGVAAGICVSDKRLKNNIRPFNLGLRELLAFEPVSFRFNGRGEHAETSQREVGLIAQEIEKSAPGLVTNTFLKLNPDDKALTKVKQVNYTSLIYIVINSIKDFYKMSISDHQSKLNKIASLKSKLHEVEIQNEELRGFVCKKDPKWNQCPRSLP